MKIQCDMCEKVEASLFCPSDEAALCHSCDHIIHNANKLATKHSRFSLINPKSKSKSKSKHQLLPLCDICQERRALLFCKEDRAILCKECDLPIHKANQHTQKHNRFLLTGVKLSTTTTTCFDFDFDFDFDNPVPVPVPAADSSSSTNNNNNNNNNFSQPNIPTTTSSVSNENLTISSFNNFQDNVASDSASSLSTSSISEYLIQTIPGYCFEDLIS